MSQIKKDSKGNVPIIDIEIEQELNSTTAFEISNKAALEAKSIFSIPIKSWKLETSFIIPNNTQRGNIYSLPLTVNGKAVPFPMIMTTIRIGKNKDDFFEFLASTEGYKFLDPDSDSSDFNKPLLGPFPLPNNNHPSSKVQVEFASLTLPGYCCSCANTREYIVMNSFDFENKAWYCKSVLTSVIYPGHSTYTTEIQNNSNTAIITGKAINESSCIRVAYNSCYIVTDDADGESNNIPGAITNNDDKISPLSRKESNVGNGGNCLLKAYQWVDLGGWLGPINSSSNKIYFTNLIDRAEKMFPVVSKARNPIS